MAAERKNPIPSAATIEIFVEWTCPYCKGEKIVQNPIWKRFWEEKGADYKAAVEKDNPETERDENGDRPSDRLISAFMAEHGYSPKDWPEEEIACHECEETGKTGAYATLEEIVNHHQGLRALLRAPAEQDRPAGRRAP